MSSFCNKSVGVTLLCTIFFFDWSTQQKILQVQPAVLQIIRQQAETCSKETGVPASTLKLVIDWKLPNDEPTKKFLYCLTVNTGFGDSTGHIHADKVAALKTEESVEELKAVINECNKIHAANEFDTIYAMGDCMFKGYNYKVTIE